MAVKRTPEQEAVVKNRGGGLLVSAAAGSGKTRVLVERLLDRILNEGKNVDEFLIITFTRAAAEELRGRIAKEIGEMLELYPENTHLRRQTARLYKAQISTIHAFCTVLLRQWGHLLDIPADFSLCDEEEEQVLMARTMEQVLESRYEEIDTEGNFVRLLDVLASGRDDSRLTEIALDIYGKVQSYPNPSAWLEEQRRALKLSGVTDMGDTPWGKLLLEDAAQTANYWVGQMELVCKLSEEDEVLKKAYWGSVQKTIQELKKFAAAAERSWDETVAESVTFPRVGPASNAEDIQLKKQVQSIRNRCKKTMEELAEKFSDTSAELLSDLAVLCPALEGLIDLVEDFSAAYQQEKRQRSLLDFSDLEHDAVRLLVDENGDPTQLARQWGSQYTEIMVDEYQDTNQVQNAIFSALSQEGKNLFMVGDVKQSIYRFRLADPTIFLRKYRTFAHWEEAATGENRKITMSKNFRSRPEVLEAANYLFRSIMSRELGEMDYTEAEALYPGGTFPEGAVYETELHVLNFQDDPALTEEKLSRHFLEARFVARRISELIRSGFPVSDGHGGTRPVQPDDIAILLRSPGPVRHYYTLALEEQSVNWTAEEGGDFFQTTEISVALSWLQIIDNPRQDVPLLAVLRSPVCGFSGDRLAEIRSAAEGDFYTALTAAAEQGQADCQDFLKELEELRFGAGEQSSHQLLWELYRRTDLLEIFGAMPGGEKRRENLLSFYELARRFEGTGHRGLFGFLLHLNRVQESGGLRPASAPAKEGAGVKILSIHRSKGLEYPVVFLCGLGRRFNYLDIQKPVLFHPVLGLGARGTDRVNQVEFTTVSRTGVGLALKKEMLAEEMRLLYVAMTRAKEKLIMTHSLSFGEKDLQGLADGVSYPVDPRVLSSCNCVGKWIILAAMVRPEGEILRKKAEAIGAPAVGVEYGPRWGICYHEGAVSEEAQGEIVSAQNKTEIQLTAEEILSQLRWAYPYQQSAATPAKVTATQLKEVDEEQGVFLLEQQKQEEPKPFYRPEFAQEAMGLTAAQKGTALHTAIQCIRLDRTGTLEEIREELARMVAEDYLTETQVKAVEPSLLVRFFASEVGQEMRQSADLHREYPFSVLASANRFYPDTAEGEELLLQGVIDCWYRRLDGITLVDFKSDRVSPAFARERAEKYRGQLAAYAHALEEITGEKVTRRIIWFLRSNVGISLD